MQIFKLPLSLIQALAGGFFAALHVTATAFSRLSHRFERSFSVVSKDKNTGQVRWNGSFRAKKMILKDLEFLRICGKGVESEQSESRYKSWHSSSYFLTNNSKITPYRIEVVYKNQEGEIVKSIDKFYDQEDRKVTCDINGKKSEFAFKEGIVDEQDLAIFLMSFPFNEKGMLKFPLLTHRPSLHDAAARYCGMENIRVNGRKIRCHKLEMVLNLGLLNIVRPLLPKYYFWFETREPHYFVKFDGLERGPGSRHVEIEAA